MSDLPDRFDELLSGAVDTATRAASPRGAETARRRGGTRRARRRLVASAMSLVLLGAVGGVAAATFGGSAKHTPAGSPTPGASQTWSVVASPNPNTSQNSTVTAPNPDTVAPSAWLSGTQLPFGTGYSDTWAIESPAGPENTLLTDSVYKQHPGIVFCGALISGAVNPIPAGAVVQQYRAFDGSQKFTVRGQAFAELADQQILFFSTAAAAQSAWNTVPSDFEFCKQQLTNNTTNDAIGSVEQTVNQSDAECWSTLVTGTGTPSAASGDLMHFCFVRAGKLITVVSVYVNDVRSFSVVDFGSTDPTTVSDLRQALSAAYGAAY
jgi:hypothetical protein